LKKVSKEITRSVRQNQLEKERKNKKIIKIKKQHTQEFFSVCEKVVITMKLKHISGAAIESHMQTCAIYRGEMRNHIEKYGKSKVLQSFNLTRFDVRNFSKYSVALEWSDFIWGNFKQ
jgi:hypothetical protein